MDEGEEDMISQQTSLDMSCHLGDLPNYQQRTWKEIFNLLKRLIKFVFPKADPCTPSALSVLRRSPQVSTLCQKGPSGGLLISCSRGGGGEFIPVTVMGSPVFPVPRQDLGGGHSPHGESPLTSSSLAVVLSPSMCPCVL